MYKKLNLALIAIHITLGGIFVILVAIFEPLLDLKLPHGVLYLGLYLLIEKIVTDSLLAFGCIVFLFVPIILVPLFLLKINIRFIDLKEVSYSQAFCTMILVTIFITIVTYVLPVIICVYNEKISGSYNGSAELIELVTTLAIAQIVSSIFIIGRGFIKHSQKAGTQDEKED